MPVHAPLQPTNRRPAAGSSVSAVWVPPSHWVVHDDAQARPGTTLATVPAPEIVSASGMTGAAKRWSQAES